MNELSLALKELEASVAVLASDLLHIGLRDTAYKVMDAGDEIRQAIKEIEQDANIHD